jgi:hypothetical protein
VSGITSSRSAGISSPQILQFLPLVSILFYFKTNEPLRCIRTKKMTDVDSSRSFHQPDRFIFILHRAVLPSGRPAPYRSTSTGRPKPYDFQRNSAR